MTIDWGKLAQDAAEKHLEACWEAHYADEDGDFERAGESPASAPFCGCETCVVREILHAAWPFVENYVCAEIEIVNGVPMLNGQRVKA